MSTAAEFFSHLDARFAAAGVGEVLWLSIRGYKVRVEFRGMVPSDVMRTNLKFMLSEPLDAVDERLCIWQDDLDDVMSMCMVPEDQRTVHFQQTDEYYLLMSSSSGRIGVRDNDAHVTYICYERGKATPETCATKPFTNEIQWWLWNDYILMHGAAVGSNGKGALITAPSGGGKSTLALAALGCGMDFAGEDFVLVPQRGFAQAYALYPTGNLLPDTLALFPELSSRVLIFMEGRNKYVVDLSSYGSRFKESLPIDVLIFPVICNADEPSIVRTHSMQRYMTAVVSSAKQVKSCGELAESVKAIFARLKNIPAYEMRLACDPMANAVALRTFLDGLGGAL